MNYSGKLLIATPSLLDPNFCQSVVLLIQGTDEDGVLGLVLNRVSDKPIRELWESVFHQNCATEACLHLGGPVFGPLFALHTCGEWNDIEIVPGVYFATTKETLDRLVDDESGDFRFFVGNAGWGRGQLTDELRAGAWYLAEASVESVFADETEIWRRLIGEIGRNILGEMLHTDHIPDDPGLN